MANLHWYLQYLMLWLLLAVPRSRSAVGWMTVLALVLALTEPQCVLQLPLAIYVFVRRRRSRLVVLGAALGIALQAATYLIAPRSTTSGSPPLASAVKGYLVNAVLSDGYASGGAIEAVLSHVGWWFAVAAFLVLLAFAGLAVWLGESAVRLAVAAALLASFGSWFGSFYINKDPNVYYSDGHFANLLLVRWGTAAAMLLLASIPLAVGAVLDRFPDRWRLGAATIGLMVAVMSLSLVSPDNSRGATTSPWIPSLGVARATCQAASRPPTAVIPTPPKGWYVAVPCSDLLDGSSGP